MDDQRHLKDTGRDRRLTFQTRRQFLVGMAAAGTAACFDREIGAAAEAITLPATVAEAGRRLRGGGLTAEVLTRAHLACIGQLNPKLNAFITDIRGEDIVVTDVESGAIARMRAPSSVICAPCQTHGGAPDGFSCDPERFAAGGEDPNVRTGLEQRFNEFGTCAYQILAVIQDQQEASYLEIWL